MKPARTILSINGGSSSIKFASFDLDLGLEPRLAGEIERIGFPEATLHVKDFRTGENESRLVAATDYKTAVAVLIECIDQRIKAPELVAIGHRLVQGGPNHSNPEKLTAEVINDLKAVSRFDPEHLPGELSLIEAFHTRYPNLPQVVCFDTHFHKNLPRPARILPIPRRYEAKGIRRYGFHGLSYQFLVDELNRLGDPAAINGRVILAHLGNGASLCAVLNGKSIDTSMSFTPTSGLPMSTRSGDLDPDLAWYMQVTENMNAKEFSNMVGFQSGLLGISETSSDMRDLLLNETQDVRAAEAVEVFCYQLKKWIGAFAAALGGLDTLVFAGGIGENAPAIRDRVCKDLSFLGVELDENQQEPRQVGPSFRISKTESKVNVWVIKTNEERVIAENVCRVIGLSPHSLEI